MSIEHFDNKRIPDDEYFRELTIRDLPEEEKEKKRAEWKKQAEQKARATIEENKALERELNKADQELDSLLFNFDEIGKGEGYPVISVGIPALDNLIGGGAMPLMYFLLAKCGAGKTTLLLQIAEHMATAEDVPVLYVSLEMKKKDLLNKLISKASFEIDREKGVSFTECATGNIPKEKREIYNTAVNSLKEKNENGNLFILDTATAKEPITALRIKNYAEKIKSAKGKAPVVMVDYLQFLAPMNKGGEIREKVNANLQILKTINETLSTPVFVISSVSRGRDKDGNAYAIDIASAKESGEIEYTADVVMKLEREGDIATITILKSRYSGEGKPLELDFEGEQSRFCERNMGE